MLALSVQQPWPWLIFHGGKDVENRTWEPPQNVLGRRIAIHASKGGPKLDPLDVLEDIFRLGVTQTWGDEIPSYDDLPRGVLLGTVRLTQITRSGETQARDGRRSPWFVGPVGWVLADPVALAEPIPVRGHLGLWTVPPAFAPALESAA